MSKSVLLLLAAIGGLRAEILSMSLRQAVEAAVRQNPDIALARLDEEKARQAVRVAKDPFRPRLVLGSGLAKTVGFPMSVDGTPPSIVQVNASQFLFNRPQSYTVARAGEDVRGATIAVAGKREEVAYRVTELFLDAERAVRIGALARRDAESQQRVLAVVQAQVREGRALPVAEKAAAYNLARSRQLADGMESDQATAETALALALGLSAEDRVRPVEETRPAPALPTSQEAAVRAAIESNHELRRLESQIAAKEIEIRGTRAERLPQVDLIAQYAMLARFNNYEDFYRKYQRNNAQIGVSFQLPLATGPGLSARAAQSQIDVKRLRLDVNNVRNRLTSDIQQSFRDVKKAEGSAELARLDLDLSREQLSVALAQMQEGRAALRQVEELRIVENQKWIAFYDAQYALERAQWNVLRLTGELLASLEKPAPPRP